MQYENLQLFGASEVLKTSEGLRLLRYPEKVIEGLGVPEYDKQKNFVKTYTGHTGSARVCVGIEIRFVYAGDKIEFTLFGEKPVSVMVFVGDYQVGYYRGGAGKNTFQAIRSSNSFGVRADSIHRYPMNLWRIVPASDEPITLVDVKAEGGYTKPAPDKKRTMLAYGSSISQGCGTPFVTMNYLDVAANILGVELKNKALAGGCFCEESVLAFMQKEEFDFAYLELGTNIADRPVEVIEERVGKFIDKMAETFPEKKFYLMTPITGLSDVSDSACEYGEYFANTRRIISEHAKKYKNTLLLDGHELLDKGWYLTADILHPSAYGHVMMGVKLACMLKEKGEP